MGSEGEFAGRVVLVTGGSSGIGLAAARRFAEAGARVAILARGEERLRRAAEEIDSRCGKGTALPLVCDVTHEAAVIQAFGDTLERLGRLDVVVSNAGSIRFGPMEELTLAAFQEMLDVHCTGYFLVAREAVRVFKRQGQGGNIVFVVSDNAIRPSRGLLAYCVAKAGELHMARCLAEECGSLGIRVNSVLPGAVFGDSALWTPEFRANRAARHGFDPARLEEEYKKNNALGVVIDPQEVAELILFLASERAAKITGAAVSLDGGGTASYVR